MAKVIIMFKKLFIVSVVAAPFLIPATALAYSEASSQASFQAPSSFESLLPQDYSGYGYWPAGDQGFVWVPPTTQQYVDYDVYGRVLTNDYWYRSPAPQVWLGGTPVLTY